MNEDIISDLTPTTDPDTGRHVTKNYRDYYFAGYSYDYFDVTEKINMSLDITKKMGEFIHDITDQVNDSLTELLGDWVEAKSIAAGMDRRIEEEKAKVAKILEAKIGAMTRELLKKNADLEKQQAKVKEIEVKIKEMGLLETELKQTKQKLADREFDVTQRTAKLHKVEEELEALKAEKKDCEEKIGSLAQERSELQEVVEGTRQELRSREEELTTTKEQLTEIHEERDMFQANYERMTTKEDIRLNQLVSTPMQTEPVVAEVAVQTEFLNPPVSRRMYVAF